MANLTERKLDLSDLSDEEPTHEMTLEDWVHFCGGDLVRANLFADFQGDLEAVAPLLILPQLPTGLRDTNVFPFRRADRETSPVSPRAVG